MVLTQYCPSSELLLGMILFMDILVKYKGIAHCEACQGSDTVLTHTNTEVRVGFSPTGLHCLLEASSYIDQSKNFLVYNS